MLTIMCVFPHHKKGSAYDDQDEAIFQPSELDGVFFKPTIQSLVCECIKQNVNLSAFVISNMPWFLEGLNPLK